MDELKNMFDKNSFNLDKIFAYVTVVLGFILLIQIFKNGGGKRNG